MSEARLTGSPGALLEYLEGLPTRPTAPAVEKHATEMDHS